MCIGLWLGDVLVIEANAKWSSHDLLRQREDDTVLDMKLSEWDG